MGVTLAIFHSLGSLSCMSERLKSLVTAGAILEAVDLRILGFKESEPLDLEGSMADSR